MTRAGMTWAKAFVEVGCYGFLSPIAAHAVDEVLGLCPDTAPLIAGSARDGLRNLCVKRLAVVYERPLTQLAVRRIGFSESLLLSGKEETRAEVMLEIAKDVRDEVAADSGASLRARMPLLAGYERAIAGNFTAALTELFARLLAKRDEISAFLLGGRAITRVVGISADGSDSHRHGRVVMRVDTDAGTFYYKPHDCRTDELYRALVNTWLPNSARAAKLVPGDGYAFVEQLVPQGLANEEQLRAYWRNLGSLTALFLALGSRDMTQDNIMCCGEFPAALDLETLLVGRFYVDESMIEPPIAVPDGAAGSLADSVICTSVLPARMGDKVVSPLVADNPAGTCLPRVGGEPRTVKGCEPDFIAGFEEGYRCLMRHREEICAQVESFADATCRQILVNTPAYVRARALLFSPGAMADPSKRDDVLAKLNAVYAPLSQELAQVVAESDAAALAEGDIPYYCSHAGARTLLDGDGRALGEHLVRSAIEVATARLAQLSEDNLRFELGVIRTCLDQVE